MSTEKQKKKKCFTCTRSWGEQITIGSISFGVCVSIPYVARLAWRLKKEEINIQKLHWILS